MPVLGWWRWIGLTVCNVVGREGRIRPMQSRQLEQHHQEQPHRNQDLCGQKTSRRPIHARDDAVPETLRRTPNLQIPHLISWVGSDPINRVTWSQTTVLMMTWDRRNTVAKS